MESFLNRADETTKDLCLLSKQDVKVLWPTKKDEVCGSQVAHVKAARWFRAGSWRRWAWTISFIALAVVTVGALFGVAEHNVELKGATIGSLGFGQVQPAAIITGGNIESSGSAAQNILASILIANTSQTIFSFLYLNLNGLLTSMWLAAERSDFEKERKPLRVSRPKGQQRSTHFLQLPYKVAIPLMVISGGLHWLISQSIFPTVLAEYDPSGNLYDAVSIASCGFSPMAMVFVLIAGGFLIAGTILLGFFSYSGAIPLVGSCSAAISAACHRPPWDDNAALKPVKWGVVPEMGDPSGVGHCTFSSGDVEPLQNGERYAGGTRVRQRECGRDIVTQ